jgi:hypothetical protein
MKITCEGIRFVGKKTLVGFPWPWRWPKYWRWYVGPGPFTTESGVIMWAMNYGIVTPFCQIVTEKETQ